MPTITIQPGFTIFIFTDEHGAPHVHVVGNDFNAKVVIENGDIVAGSIPAPHRRRALRWIAANRVTLLDHWAEFTGL